MPRLEAVARYLGLILREAQDESEFPCILSQPLVYLLICERNVRAGEVVHITAESRLMLARAGARGIGLYLRFRLFLRPARMALELL